MIGILRRVVLQEMTSTFLYLEYFLIISYDYKNSLSLYLNLYKSKQVAHFVLGRELIEFSNAFNMQYAIK